eukprot:907827-Pyramimonas_sp.AAC.1
MRPQELSTGPARLRACSYKALQGPRDHNKLLGSLMHASKGHGLRPPWMGPASTPPPSEDKPSVPSGEALLNGWAGATWRTGM